jgi:hypothetical protein
MLANAEELSEGGAETEARAVELEAAETATLQNLSCLSEEFQAGALG